MANEQGASLPVISPEQRRVAAGQFERANQVIATGNFDYGIQLLLNCCKLDPSSLIYRQALRKTEKIKYKNNLKGSNLAMLSNSATKLKLKGAKQTGDYLKVLEYGEEILTRNPWDTGTQLDMAEAAEVLGLLDLAAWTLDQARQKNPLDAQVNRSLARVLERRGNFTQAMQAWELVRRADPNDKEAQQKANDLAAKDTIVRGHYAAGVEGKPGDGTPVAEAKADEHATPTSGLARQAFDRVSQEVAGLRQRLSGDPTNPQPYLQMALRYRRADQLDDAKQVLIEGLAATGNQFELHIELADLEIEPFRRNLAIADEMLREQPEDEELRRNRIRLLKEINTRELELFREKANRFPTESQYRFELGVRLLRAGLVDEAIVELQKTRSDNRLRWKALLYLGHCFKSRHNWRLAERNFQEALEAVPASEEAARKDLLFQLAHGSAEAGDFAKAVEVALELANLDFGYRDIGRHLDEWQQRINAGPSAAG